MKTVVLGASGMLGQAVAQIASKTEPEITQVSRSQGYRWDAHLESFSSLAKNLSLEQSDWLVNCVGWIPQKAKGNLAQDSSDAKRLNSGLPAEISAEKASLGFGWIQIATDCVFRGDKGPYGESAIQDAGDLYGSTKIKGESSSHGAILIRCSIIGPDENQRSGLFEWFRSLPHDAEVSGYTNHLWNGVSTLVFSKLSAGIIGSDRRHPVRHHLVPLGHASKYELLCLFKELTGRSDVRIVPTRAKQSVDRRLITEQPALNEELWGLAGYSRAQTIEEMCEELVAFDKERTSD
jgi:dTDP-4-dehydrorhamnose reductase